jgi:hypothetical protein
MPRILEADSLPKRRRMAQGTYHKRANADTSVVLMDQPEPYFSLVFFLPFGVLLDFD